LASRTIKHSWIWRFYEDSKTNFWSKDSLRRIIASALTTWKRKETRETSPPKAQRSTVARWLFFEFVESRCSPVPFTLSQRPVRSQRPAKPLFGLTSIC
jgi:hypothetical protein